MAKENTEKEKSINTPSVQYSADTIVDAADLAAKQRKLSYQIKRNKESYLMMFPYFLLFFFFTILPVAMSMFLSFTNFNMLEWPTFVGWRNYIKLFLEDDIFIVALNQ